MAFNTGNESGIQKQPSDDHLFAKPYPYGTHGPSRFRAPSTSTSATASPSTSAPVRLMPRPCWTRTQYPLFLTMEQYTILIVDAEHIFRSVLAEQNYDSVSNLLELYDVYMKTGIPLHNLFTKITSRIIPNKLTCVGLALELLTKWQQLDQRFGGFSTAASLVSCDQGLFDIKSYATMAQSPMSVASADKDHVMVCVQVVVDGRPGVLLGDLGQHISRVVTVMRDQAYPHTGTFTQSEAPWGYKEFHFQFSVPNYNYVEFFKRTRRDTDMITKTHCSLIYVAQPYLNYMPITEKRNLVVDFRALVSRTHDGRLGAGIYFSLPGSFKAKLQNEHPSGQFTIFSDHNGVKHLNTYFFIDFMTPEYVPESVQQEFETCSLKLKFHKEDLLNVIFCLASIMNNKSFVVQVLDLHDNISRDFGVTTNRARELNAPEWRYNTSYY